MLCVCDCSALSVLARAVAPFSAQQEELVEEFDLADLMNSD